MSIATPKKIGSAQLSTSSAIVGNYAVPAARIMILQEIVICNTGNTDATVSVCINTTNNATAAKAIMWQYPIPAYGTHPLGFSVVMNPSDSVIAVASNSNVTIYASGSEIA